MAGKLVLVTGANGYIASHIIYQLLEEGYKVRGTVRSLKDPEKHAPLYTIHPKGKENLELVEVPVLERSDWTNVVKGVDYICHCASPLPSQGEQTDDEMVIPARDGSLNVLKAAAKEKSVKRIIVTSSIDAITDPGVNTHMMNERNWANPTETPKLYPYNKSKAIAERACWAFYESLPSDSRFELCTIQPVLVTGPFLYNNPSVSCDFVKSAISNTFEFSLPLCCPLVDVRDVARAHVICLTLPEAAGFRHMLNTQCTWDRELREYLKKEFGPQGYNIATEEASPQKFQELCDEFRMMKRASVYWSEPLKLDTTRFTKVLGINPISIEKSIIDTAYSYIEFGYCKKTPGYTGPKKA